jgi:hypothetical protein
MRLARLRDVIQRPRLFSTGIGVVDAIIDGLRQTSLRVYNPKRDHAAAHQHMERARLADGRSEPVGGQSSHVVVAEPERGDFRGALNYSLNPGLSQLLSSRLRTLHKRLPQPSWYAAV